MSRTSGRRGIIKASPGSVRAGAAKDLPGFILTVEVRDVELLRRDLGTILDSIRTQAMHHLSRHKRTLEKELSTGQTVLLLTGLHSGANPLGAALLTGMVRHTATVVDPTPNADGDILVSVPSFGELRVLPEFVRGIE